MVVRGGADRAGRIQSRPGPRFAATPQQYTFGVCAAGGTAPICAVDPNTVPKAVDMLTPAGVAQATSSIRPTVRWWCAASPSPDARRPVTRGASGPCPSLRAVTEHRLTRTQARRIAIRAQLLDRPRPTDLIEVVGAAEPAAGRCDRRRRAERRSGGVVQAGLVLLAGRADRVAAGRFAGRAARHDPAGRGPGALPGRDGRVARRRRGAWLARHQGDWVEANEACRVDILERLDAEGPLCSRELPDTCAVPWRSSGWNNNRNVEHDAGVHGDAR